MMGIMNIFLQITKRRDRIYLNAFRFCIFDLTGRVAFDVFTCSFFQSNIIIDQYTHFKTNKDLKKKKNNN